MSNPKEKNIKNKNQVHRDREQIGCSQRQGQEVEEMVEVSIIY